MSSTSLPASGLVATTPGERARAAFLRALLSGFAVAVLVYLLLPTLFVIPISFSDQLYLTFPPPGWSVQWYENLFGTRDWLLATWNSVVIGVPTALLSVVLGTLAALAVVRGTLRFVSVAAALMVAPMMLPHVILAIGLYPVLLEMGLLRTHLAAIIGHTVIAAPLVFIAVSASLRQYDVSLELAAMTLGANRLHTFRHVTLPMIAPGAFAGGILAFATSFDELMLSLFLTGAGTRTLPRLIWEQLNDFLTPVIAAAATLVFVFSVLLIAVAARVGARRAGSTPGEGDRH